MVVDSNLHMGFGIVRGDQFSIRRTVVGLPSGNIISSAQLTVKSAYSISDAGATIHKDINTTNNEGVGQVEDAGSNGTGRIRFDLEAEDTEAFVADNEYYFDIQIKLNNGSILTLEKGITSAKEQVTQT